MSQYSHQPTYSYPPVKPNPFKRFLCGVGRFLRMAFLIFHYTAYAVSWIYIIVPIFGWNKHLRLLMGYIAVSVGLVGIIYSAYTLMTTPHPIGGSFNK